MKPADTSYRIVIPTDRELPPGTAGQIKGRTLEKLSSYFLKFQNYTVVERLRDAGTEIDLLCRSQLTEAVAVVECKAQERTLQSDVINKLFTDVSLYDASNGWIISLTELGSEARTRLEKLNVQHPSRKLRFFSGNALIPMLVDGGILEPPKLNDSVRTSRETLLLLRDDQRFWAIPVLDRNSLRPIGHLCWDAATGHQISPGEAPDLAATDFPNAELGWLPHAVDLRKGETIKAQPVIEVIPGDEWSDYRPSRPDDFVGREALIAEIAEFFEGVARGVTSTRILGIKGRSGWGKSSLALKLAHQFGSRKVFVLPVDCRAANSSFYADLSVSKAISQAAKEMFFGPLFAPTSEFRSNPFDDAHTASFVRSVAASGGVICLIFDQFEAIIHRPELKSTLERMRELALLADEFRSGFVIGFSWKTDGTVGSDNPGYYLWHSLADRRRDFEVDRFTREDADHFIALALRSAHVQLPRSVIHFILEQYAGYPWLLKKLIKHCVDDVKRTGSVANLNSFFNISSLFENDMQELSNVETIGIKFIAREAPVELHVAEDRCGASAISSLIDKRLVIKSGSHLSLYWDIFRDYVLNGQIPKLPNTYIPTLSVRKIRSVVRLITQSPTMTYISLANHLGISVATADNTVRDLSNIGLVDSQRILGSFESLCPNPQSATEKIIDFLRSHTVYIHTKDLIETGGTPTLSTIELSTRDEYSFVSIDKRTLRTYIRKIIVYCLEFGLLARRGHLFELSSPIENILDSQRRTLPLLEDDVFRGAASPARVIDLLKELKRGECGTLEKATAQKLRNAVYAASRLGLVVHRGGRVQAIPEVFDTEDLEVLVSTFAQRIEPMHSTLANLNVQNHSADEVGTFLSDMLELNWSPSSCRRYGFAIRDWCMWIEYRQRKADPSNQKGAV